MSVTSDEITQIIDQLSVIRRRREWWLKGQPRSELGQAITLLTRALVQIDSREQESLEQARAARPTRQRPLTSIERMIGEATGYEAREGQ